MSSKVAYFTAYLVRNFHYSQLAQRQSKYHFPFHKNGSLQDLSIMTLVLHSNKIQKWEKGKWELWILMVEQDFWPSSVGIKKKPEEGWKPQSQEASFRLSQRAKFQKENQGLEFWTFFKIFPADFWIPFELFQCNC